MPFALFSVELLLLCSSILSLYTFPMLNRPMHLQKEKYDKNPCAASGFISFSPSQPFQDCTNTAAGSSQQNKLLIWLHHLPPSMCTFPSPATSLNLQQGRDWQLNRKLLNTEGSEASNEPDTVIIAFFWKPKSLQTSIALGILYKGTVNTSVHSQSPDRLKCRHSPIQNKQSTQ